MLARCWQDVRKVLAWCWQVLSRCWQVLARCSECDGKVLAVCQQCTYRLKTPLRHYISQSSQVQTFIKTSHLTHTNSCQHLASILPAPCQHLASTLPAAYRQQPVPRCRLNASRLQTAASTLQPAHRQQRTDNSQYLVAVKTLAVYRQLPAFCSQHIASSVRTTVLGQCQARVGSVSGQNMVSVRSVSG